MSLVDPLHYYNPGRGGDSHVKFAGIPVENFEINSTEEQSEHGLKFIYPPKDAIL